MRRGLLRLLLVVLLLLLRRLLTLRAAPEDEVAVGTRRRSGHLAARHEVDTAPSVRVVHVHEVQVAAAVDVQPRVRRVPLACRGARRIVGILFRSELLHGSAHDGMQLIACATFLEVAAGLSHLEERRVALIASPIGLLRASVAVGILPCSALHTHCNDGQALVQRG